MKDKKWGCIVTGYAMNVQLCFSVVICDVYSTCVEIQVTYLGTVWETMMTQHKNEVKKLYEGPELEAVNAAQSYMFFGRQSTL